jgi:hydroxypyruvate isomerase
MLGWSANVSTLYSDLPFVERLGAAARDGFRCVEFWTSDDHAAAASAIRELGLAVSVVNVDPGPDADDAGRLSDPDSAGWWKAEFERTLELVRTIGFRSINLLAGGRRDLDPGIQRRTMLANLEWALAEAQPRDVSLLLEPLNRADRGDYLLHTVDDVVDVRIALGNPRHLKLLFDVYHVHQEHPDVATIFERSIDIVGHVQFADYPGRGEPGSGEIDFGSFLRAAERCGYHGWIGLEYQNDGRRDSLAWTRALPALP